MMVANMTSRPVSAGFERLERREEARTEDTEGTEDLRKKEPIKVRPLWYDLPELKVRGSRIESERQTDESLRCSHNPP
jgi:hypothetical protein